MADGPAAPAGAPATSAPASPPGSPKELKAPRLPSICSEVRRKGTQNSFDPDGSAPYGEVVLCKPSMSKTLLASFFAFLFMLAGLMAWSIAEVGIPGFPRDERWVIIFRCLGWICMYFVPVHIIGISNIRCFTVYGRSPGNTSLVCCNTGLGPVQMSDLARQAGQSVYRGFAASLLMHGICLSIYVIGISMYIGDSHQHCGFILVYGLGHIIVIVVCESIAPFISPLPDPVVIPYAAAMGPATLGVILIGFFAGTTAYSMAKRLVGAWLGILMPPVLGIYELIATMIIGQAFSRKFVTNKAVREQYLESNQGIVVSLSVALAHAMAEGARLTLILVDIAHDSRDWDFMVPILCGLLWNITARAGGVDLLLAISTCGRRTPTQCSLLLQDVKYCMGYPRFFAVGAIAVARVLNWHPVLPPGQDSIGLALATMFAAEVVEDVVSMMLAHVGLRVHPRPPYVSDDEVESMAAQQLRAPGKKSTRSLSAVLPGPTQPGEAANAESVRDQSWRIREALDFAYREQPYEELPFWGHFAVVAVAQYHTVLFLVLLSNGLSYVLGICNDAGYMGLNRGILWWPIADPSNPCEL